MSQPNIFTHQGVEYLHTGMSLRKRTANAKMEEWFRVMRADEGEQSAAVWVCDGYTGEFVQVFVPRDQAKDMINAG